MGRLSADPETDTPAVEALPGPFTLADAYAMVEAECRRLNPSLDYIHIEFGREGKTPNRLVMEFAETEEPAMTPMETDVFSVVRDMKKGDVLTAGEIAEAAEVGNSDSSRAFIRKLASMGFIKKVARGWQRI